MGSIALSSPFRSLSQAIAPNNASLPSFGGPIAAYKYTGAVIDMAFAALGAPTVASFPSVPTDAVGVELWANSDSAGNGLAFAVRSGQLSNTGVLATNTSTNTGASGSLPSQFVISGSRMVIPLPSVGAAIPSGWRFAGLNTDSMRLQGRYIAEATAFPYLATATEELLLIGAGASQQLPFGTAAKFPTGYVGAKFQVIGAGMRFTLDGTVPTATLGDFLPAGVYVVDQAVNGISLSALRVYMPSSTFIVGISLMGA